MTQRQIAKVFGVSIPTINEHLAGIYVEEELDPARTVRQARIVQTEGKRSVSRLVEQFALPTRSCWSTPDSARSSSNIRFRLGERASGLAPRCLGAGLNFWRFGAPIRFAARRWHTVVRLDRRTDERL